MKELLVNLFTIIGAVVVYFGVLVFVPKIIKSKYINKKLGR